MFSKNKSNPEGSKANHRASQAFTIGIWNVTMTQDDEGGWVGS